MKTLNLLSLFFTFTLLFVAKIQAGELYAYIDPFTGSLIIQVLAMAFLSILVFFKNLKAKVLGIFGYGKIMKSEQTEDELETVKLERSELNEDRKVA